MDFTDNNVSQITESKAQQGTKQEWLQRGDLCHDTQKGENTLERCPRCREMDIYFHAKFSRVDIFFSLNLIKYEELEDLFALGTAQTGPRHFSVPHVYLHVKRSIQWFLKSLPAHASFVLYTPTVSTNSTTKKIQKIINYTIHDLKFSWV